MKRPTSERIREYLRKNQQSTSQELADVLGLTKSAIQYQLQKMEREKIITAQMSRRSANRGRPEKIYRLHPAGNEDNFQALCELLLEILGADDRQFERALTRVGNLMANRVGCSGPLTRRLGQLVRFLTQHGYQANWEAHRNGPMIILKNCPYTTIIDKHPLLCLMDLQVLKNALRVEVNQVEKMRPEEVGRPNLCRFLANPELMKND